jgi:hypothetical protein
MSVYAARRINDGLLAALTDVPNMPTNLTERAIASYGGDPSEWETVALTEAEAAQLPDNQNGANIFLNTGIITIVMGFPRNLAETQRGNFQRGFIINKKVTDFRKRTVTRIEV